MSTSVSEEECHTVADCLLHHVHLERLKSRTGSYPEMLLEDPPVARYSEQPPSVAPELPGHKSFGRSPEKVEEHSQELVLKLVREQVLKFVPRQVLG